MYGHKLNVIRLGQKNYLDRIEKALSDGSTILIENIGESVDPVLDSLLGRNLIKKGRQVTISGFSPKDLSNLSELIWFTLYFSSSLLVLCTGHWPIEKGQNKKEGKPHLTCIPPRPRYDVQL